MVLSGSYGSVDRAQALQTLQSAADAGITLFDTADVYGAGENERLLGEALRARRQEVLFATKGGASRDAQGKATNCGAPDYLIQACEASLARLGVEHIDLYYLHRADPAVPIEDSVGALARLVEQGKVGAIGLSEVSEETLRRAHAVHPIAALQSEFSLACRQPAESMFEACRELGVSFVAYSPLGRGLLAGTGPGSAAASAQDLRSTIPRFNPDNLAHNLHTVERMKTLADGLGISSAQLALAWVLNRPLAVFAIPGTRSVERVGLNVAAAELTLPGKVFAELDDIFSEGAIKGARHNARMLSRVGL
jgi:aryl-alcohol dehydrogenase-like predicted oxidoreductase